MYFEIFHKLLTTHPTSKYRHYNHTHKKQSKQLIRNAIILKPMKVATRMKYCTETNFWNLFRYSNSWEKDVCEAEFFKFLENK